MPKVVDPINGLPPEKRRRVEQLEAECGRILEQLFEEPGNENLYRRLRETEIRIVTLTGETIMDYAPASVSNI
jgi:RecB family exonuclease